MARRFLAYGRALVWVLVSTTVLVAIGIAVLVKAQPQGRDDPNGPGDPNDPNAIVQQIRHLWEDLADYAGARALAEDFLIANPVLTQLRHRVEFEYAMTYYGEQNYAPAIPLMDEIVATYGAADFVMPEGALADPTVVVDDAQYYGAFLRRETGNVGGAVLAYEALLLDFPGSNRTTVSLLEVAGLYEQIGDLPAALAALQTLVQDYPDTDLAPQGQLQIGQIHRGSQAFDDALTAFLVVPVTWPESSEAPLGLFWAGVTCEQMQEPASALAHYQALQEQYPEDMTVARGQIRVGHIRVQAREFAEAVATFTDIISTWPDSVYAPNAAQCVGRAYIHEELAAREPEPGVIVESDVDRSSAIANNLQQILEQYPQSDACPGALLDAINYWAERRSAGVTPREECQAKTLALVETMRQVAPDAWETQRATLDQAGALFATDPDRAWTLANAVATWASDREELQLLNDAQYLMGRLHSNSGEYAEARAVWQSILAREQTPLFESEVRLVSAMTYVYAGDYEAAEAALSSVTENEQYPADVRASALVEQARVLKRLHDTDGAIAALEAAMTLQPETRTAAAAARLLGIYERHRLP